eukprot:s2103_g5.t1
MDWETDLGRTIDGTSVDLVAHVTLKGAGFYLCETEIKHQTFLTDIELGKFEHVTIFHAKKTVINNRIWIQQTDQTVVLGHQPIQSQGFAKVVETCAGFAAISQGYEACGCTTEEVNELNPTFVKWLKDQGKTVVVGDISHTDTMIQLAALHICCLSGGVSCQPWSFLGDQRKFHDPRSMSMVGMLKAIYFLKIPLGIMECTPGVMTAPEAQQMLASFAKQTGMIVHQKVLNLHKIWPAKRNRWWATISHPCLKLGDIPEIPPLAFEPKLVHLFPEFMTLPPAELDALRLDAEEMEAFLTTPRGMAEHQVDRLKALPTATHSWGSQKRACECGCRSSGFSDHRIREKGLYGQLIPLDETYVKDGDRVHHMRHMHPCEVALANGMHPFTKGLRQTSLRFALAGVGQMASPFQSAWVLANAFQDMANAGIRPQGDKPIRVLQKIAKDLFYARDLLFGSPSKNESLLRLEWAVELWGKPQAIPVMSEPRNFEAWLKSKGFVNPSKFTHHAMSHSHARPDQNEGVELPTGQQDAFQVFLRRCPILMATPSNHNAWQSKSDPSAQRFIDQAVQIRPQPSQNPAFAKRSVPDSLTQKTVSAVPSSTLEIADGQRNTNRLSAEAVMQTQLSRYSDHPPVSSTYESLMNPPHASLPPQKGNNGQQSRERDTLFRAKSNPVESHSLRSPDQRPITHGDTAGLFPGQNELQPHVKPAHFSGVPVRINDQHQVGEPAFAVTPHDSLPPPKGMNVNLLQHPPEGFHTRMSTLKATPQIPQVIPSQADVSPFPVIDRSGYAGHSMSFAASVPTGSQAEARPDQKPRPTAGVMQLPSGTVEANRTAYSHEHQIGEVKQTMLPNHPERMQTSIMPSQHAYDPADLPVTSPDFNTTPSSCHFSVQPHHYTLPDQATCPGFFPPAHAQHESTSHSGAGFRGPHDQVALTPPFKPPETMHAESHRTEEMFDLQSQEVFERQLLAKCNEVERTSGFQSGGVPGFTTGSWPSIERKRPLITEPVEQTKARKLTDSSTHLPCPDPLVTPGYHEAKEAEKSAKQSDLAATFPGSTPHVDHAQKVACLAHAPVLHKIHQVASDMPGERPEPPCPVMSTCQAPSALDHRFAQPRTQVMFHAANAEDRPTSHPTVPLPLPTMTYANQPSHQAGSFPHQKAKLDEQQQTIGDCPEMPHQPQVLNNTQPDDENDPSEGCADDKPAGPESVPPNEEDNQIPIYVLCTSDVPVLMHVPAGTTFGQVAVMCAKEAQIPDTHIAINTAVGSQLPLASEAFPGAVIRIEKVSDILRSSCQAHVKGGNPDVPSFGEVTREQMLWQQKGWTAYDEVQYYLQTLGAYPAGFHAPIILDATAKSKINLCQAMIDLLKTAQTSGRHQCVPVLHHGHWFPIAAPTAIDHPVIFTTPMQKNTLEQCIRECLQDSAIQVHTKGIRQRFDMDCGFQSVGWMINFAIGEDSSDPVSPEQACHWRLGFHAYLVASGTHQDTVTHIPLGGVQGVSEALANLVQSHGVSSSRSAECADQLIAAIGSAAIQRILAAPKPWVDLKSRASLCKPPIRIVNSEELQSLIKQKIQDGKPIGRKQNKQKGNAKEPPLRLKADQISVPFGVFRQQNGEEVGQIPASQIGPNSKGVILANIEEAIPYFSIQTPLSKEGLALLVLDHSDPRIPEQGKFTKVPAICVATKEPVIASATMLQLGSVQVMRNGPSETIAVQETPHAVIRASLYRDQFPGQWDEVVKGPVRKLMEVSALKKVPPHDVLDIWDRQFLSDTLRKDDPSNATVFMVNARIQQEHVDAILQQSGTHGCFFERRTPDGRHPFDGQQIIWLPRKSYAEAVVAVQTNHHPCTLARSGQRYGIRVDHQWAESTHAQHRPEVIFLNGHDLRKFRVGPLPFGSTKSSIASLFKQWQWQARPVAPVGPARDRSGMLWQVQACTNPEHWIYQVSQSDILITPEEPPPAAPPIVPNVIASDRTIQSLKKDESAGSTQAAASSDPWLHHDPWQPRHQVEMPGHQYTSMKAEIEKAVISKIGLEDDKMQTDTDGRISDLEQKFEKLSCTVASFQAAQGQQNQAMANQIQAVDNKIDQQQQSLNSMLDSKLQNQLEMIEQLFAKRQRHE